MRLYSLSEAAKIMGKSVRSVYRLVEERRIDYVVDRGTKRISEDQIRDYIKRNTVKAK